MLRKLFTFLCLPAFVLSLAVSSGCSEEGGDATQDSLEEAAAEAEDTASDVTEETGDMIEQAGDEVEEEADNY